MSFSHSDDLAHHETTRATVTETIIVSGDEGYSEEHLVQKMQAKKQKQLLLPIGILVVLLLLDGNAALWHSGGIDHLLPTCILLPEPVYFHLQI